MSHFKKMHVVVIVTLILLHAGPANGLVLSLHPVSDEKNTIFDPRLVGTWGNTVTVDFTGGMEGSVVEHVDATCTFKEANGGYEVTVKVEKILNIKLHARLVRVWGENWLEVRPSTESLMEYMRAGKINPFVVVELYSFFKVEHLGRELVLSGMDPEWILERLQTVSWHMNYAYRDFLYCESIYLTSKPHDLGPFLARISRFREALPYGVRMTRIGD